MGSLRIVAASSLFALAGCAHVEDQFREDGPSVGAEWNSPTAADVYARFQPAESRMRVWDATMTQSESGAVTHGPDYFQDPFEDKGRDALKPSGEMDPAVAGPTREDTYRLGWEDVVAAPYGYARHTLNWLGLPVSMIVTPPWTEMVSDGVLSRQALGFDHDPTRVSAEPQVPPAAEQPSKPPAGEATAGEAPQMNGLQVVPK